MAIWESFWVGKRNFEIDLVEFFANMTNGESFEGAHHNAPPGRELRLPPTSKGYGLNPLSAQFLPEASTQRIEIDVFDAAVQQVVVPSFSHPFGFTHMDPVGGPVAGSPEAVPFHEGFEQMDGVMIDFEPIVRDPFGIDGEYPGCQALDGDPGQDEEAGVIGQEVQIPYPGGMVPSNEDLSGVDSPGGRSPSQAGDRSFADKNHVFEMAAHDLPIAEIVIASHEAVVEGFKGSVSNQLENRCVKFAKASLHGSLIAFHHGRAPAALVVVGAAESWGEAGQAFSLKGEQELATGHLSRRTVGLNPLPLLTQDLGDMGPSPLPVLIDRGLDLGKESRSDCLFSYGQRFHNHRIAERSLRRHPKMHTRNKIFAQK